MRKIIYRWALCALLLVAVSANAQEAPRLPPLNDPPTATRLPGKFVWFDLATPSLGSQQGFYQDVFGWNYQSPGLSQDEYVVVMNQGSAIAGMFSAEPSSGEQDGATWIALMSVESVDDTAARVKNAGGQVELAPATVSRRGRHALLRDPADALFGVLRSETGDPEDAEVAIGGILWVDLFARDVEAMAAFYAQLGPFTLGTRSVTEGVNGKMLSANGMPRAGIVAVDEEANRSAWVPYVRVNDVDAALERAVDGGGFVIVAPDPALLDGNLGIFVDPHGGVTGVVKWDYEEGDES